jgi:hypothetical protein
MARELITENEIINENWMYTVSANADGRMSFQKIEIRGSGFLCGWIRPDGPAMVSFRAVSEPLGRIAREGRWPHFLVRNRAREYC